MNEQPKKVMTDADATDLDWFLLECFCKQLLGPRHEIQRPLKIEPALKKRAPAKSKSKTPHR